MMDITRQVTWLPEFGLDRELDWLAHMDDWMISKKRYWGLALPIYECAVVRHGRGHRQRGRAEGARRRGLGRVRGPLAAPARGSTRSRSPARACGEVVSRIPDVGNPWLDAGIVAFSTLHYRTDRDYWEKWFPADFITESFPGQFRNWFYSLLAMSTALTGETAVPERLLLRPDARRARRGDAQEQGQRDLVRRRGRAHRRRRHALAVLDGNPSQNLNFGFNVADEVRRRFILPLWNSYAFFATYARLDEFDPTDAGDAGATRRATAARPLDHLATESARRRRCAWSSTGYEPDAAATEIEQFVVEELSNWYIRRNRRRFWKSETDADKAAAYHTLYGCLTTVVGLLAPFIPFVAEEIYQNLVRNVDAAAPESVHLTDFPAVDESLIDAALSDQMRAVIEAVRLGRAARSTASVKVRQPLPAVLIYTRNREDFDAIELLRDQVLEELNVKEIRPLSDVGEVVTYSIRPNLPVLGPKYGKQLGAIRQALAAADSGMVAGLVGAERSVELTLPNGEAFWLEPSEILVDLNKRDGYAAAQGPNMTVALDTELTPELIREGWVRDFIRGVQDARKTAGLQIEDRIDLRYSAPTEIAEAIEANCDYVRSETLALSVEHVADGSGNPIEVGDELVNVQVQRATR